MEINGRKIGNGLKPYIVAELSANHSGNIQHALDTILEAKKRGADAIKLQTYLADSMTIDCDASDFYIKTGPWKGSTLYDLYKKAETPYEWHQELFDYAGEIGITCFSTPFHESAVDLLEKLNAPAYKVASFEAIDLPLISYIAKTHKPMIISTGMASFDEINEMLETARTAGCKDLILLHCVSGYPTPIQQSNVLTVPDMMNQFNVDVGLSDHSLSNTASLAAISHGACLIEKHVTLSRSIDSPDSSFSIEPDELESLCQEANDTWLSLGTAGYKRKPVEEENIIFRRSIYFIENMEAGEVISDKHIRRIRPGYGLAPKYESQIIGRKVKDKIKAGTPTSWELID